MPETHWKRIMSASRESRVRREIRWVFGAIAALVVGVQAYAAVSRDDASLLFNLGVAFILALLAGLDVVSGRQLRHGARHEFSELGLRVHRGSSATIIRWDEIEAVTAESAVIVALRTPAGVVRVNTYQSETWEEFSELLRERWLAPRRLSASA
ncbi:MAG: hypothetical protein IPJ78_19540 [Gemmatimonadetes bacterium]|nr:hypothetical protein [Gemmatimonadota bacterium]